MIADNPTNNRVPGYTAVSCDVRLICTTPCVTESPSAAAACSLGIIIHTTTTLAAAAAVGIHD